MKTVQKMLWEERKENQKITEGNIPLSEKFSFKKSCAGGITQCGKGLTPEPNYLSSPPKPTR